MYGTTQWPFAWAGIALTVIGAVLILRGQRRTPEQASRWFARSQLAWVLLAFGLFLVLTGLPRLLGAKDTGFPVSVLDPAGRVIGGIGAVLVIRAAVLLVVAGVKRLLRGVRVASRR